MGKSDGWGIAAQGEQFVESGVRPSWKFFQSVLEPSKGIQVVQFGGSQQGLNDSGTNAGEFGTCVQPFFLPMAMGRMAFSIRLLSMGKCL